MNTPFRSYPGERPPDPPVAGRVRIVGAGPGDPELLTIKARRAIREAEVILHDRLVDPRTLALAHPDTALIDVGKRPGGPAWPQEAINRLIIEHALAGALVVRLKSGDPLIFGRADEEIAAIRAAGLEVEIIPGITAASAAAAEVGVSLTRRGRNSAVTFLSAQGADGPAEHNWDALAAADSVCAIYMGVRAAAFVQRRLLEHGAAPKTPVTVVENAARRKQKIVSATLATLSQQLEQAQIRGPAVILTGLAPALQRSATEDIEPAACAYETEAV